MDSLDIIDLYEKISLVTEQMLDAARQKDWELLTQLEADCSKKIQIIKTSEQAPLLTAELKERKIRVIKKILADDKEIRNITEPWMAELSELLKMTGNTRKINHLYGSGSPA